MSSMMYKMKKKKKKEKTKPKQTNNRNSNAHRIIKNAEYFYILLTQCQDENFNGELYSCIC